MKKLLLSFLVLILSTLASFAESNTASANFSITIPRFVKVEAVSSPVLTANITDRTGNLYTPLSTTFKVISNSAETTNLYLKANVITDGGFEESMFEQGGRVYIAFANLANKPKSQSLANCKMGALPKDSPGIVAYPVLSVAGAKSKYLQGKGKYEVYAENGTTFVTVNIGSNVLRSSFAGNDPKGFYQAVLSLTEADI